MVILKSLGRRSISGRNNNGGGNSKSSSERKLRKVIHNGREVYVEILGSTPIQITPIRSARKRNNSRKDVESIDDDSSYSDEANTDYETNEEFSLLTSSSHKKKLLNRRDYSGQRLRFECESSHTPAADNGKGKLDITIPEPGTAARAVKKHSVLDDRKAKAVSPLTKEAAKSKGLNATPPKKKVVFRWNTKCMAASKSSTKVLDLLKVTAEDTEDGVIWKGEGPLAVATDADLIKVLHNESFTDADDVAWYGDPSVVQRMLEGQIKKL